MADIPATSFTHAYEACVVLGDVVRQDPDGLGHSELRSLGLFMDVQEAKAVSEKAVTETPGAIGCCTRAQHFAKGEPVPLHSKPERRFAIYEVPSDYMAPTFQPDDLVEIDTTVTRVEGDGVYLLDFHIGEPALRRIQALPGGRVRVYCDRDAGTPNVEECDECQLVILGRATRALHGRRL